MSVVINQNAAVTFCTYDKLNRVVRAGHFENTNYNIKARPEEVHFALFEDGIKIYGADITNETIAKQSFCTMGILENVMHMESLDYFYGHDTWELIQNGLVISKESLLEPCFLVPIKEDGFYTLKTYAADKPNQNAQLSFYFYKETRDMKMKRLQDEISEEMFAEIAGFPDVLKAAAFLTNSGVYGDTEEVIACLQVAYDIANQRRSFLNQQQGCDAWFAYEETGRIYCSDKVTRVLLFGENGISEHWTNGATSFVPALRAGEIYEAVFYSKTDIVAHIEFVCPSKKTQQVLRNTASDRLSYRQAVNDRLAMAPKEWSTQFDSDTVLNMLRMSMEPSRKLIQRPQLSLDSTHLTAQFSSYDADLAKQLGAILVIAEIDITLSWPRKRKVAIDQETIAVALDALFLNIKNSSYLMQVTDPQGRPLSMPQLFCLDYEEIQKEYNRSERKSALKKLGMKSWLKELAERIEGPLEAENKGSDGIMEEALESIGNRILAADTEEEIYHFFQYYFDDGYVSANPITVRFLKSTEEWTFPPGKNRPYVLIHRAYNNKKWSYSMVSPGAVAEEIQARFEDLNFFVMLDKETLQHSGVIVTRKGKEPIIWQTPVRALYQE